uniref:CagM protein n=1 Tax=Helicobacter pylori TaxID=210 RepID=E0WI19_HELPX|nr:CagM protein [Helicobacter pylori]
MLAKIVFSSLVAFGVLSANVEQFGSFFNEIKKNKKKWLQKKTLLRLARSS